MAQYNKAKKNHRRCCINSIVYFGKKTEQYSYVIIQQVPLTEKKPKFGHQFSFTRFLQKREKTRWDVYIHQGPIFGEKDNPYCYFFILSADTLREIKDRIGKEFSHEIACGLNWSITENPDSKPRDTPIVLWRIVLK